MQEAKLVSIYVDLWSLGGDHIGLSLAGPLSYPSKCFITLKLSHPVLLNGLHSPQPLLETGPGTTGVRGHPRAKLGSCQAPSVGNDVMPVGSKGKCGSALDMRPKRGLVLNPGTEKKKEKKQNWWPAAFLKSAFWHPGKYNDRADPGLKMTLESCQSPISSWQTLPGFWLVQRTSPCQCPSPPTPPPPRPSNILPL